MNGPRSDAISADQAAVVFCRNSQGLEAHGTVLRMERHRITFETYTPLVLVRSSEALSDFKVSVNGQRIYCGRAVVSNVVSTAAATICEANLDDGWVDVEIGSLADVKERLGFGFEQFLTQWQKVYRIHPEYKAIIGDLQTFLTDLRL